jgi:hypothetical protein
MMRRAALLAVFATVIAAADPRPGCGGLGDPNDWLTHGCAVSSALHKSGAADGSTTYVLSNGIVSRTLVANKTTGLLGTVSVAVATPRTEVLRQAAPEALFVVNNVAIVVGGVQPASEDARPRAKFSAIRSSSAGVYAGGFHWVPGSRGSNPATAWPPKGLHVEVDHTLACADVSAGTSGTVVVTTVYELYDETSAFGRRLRLQHNCSAPLYVFNMSFSVLEEARDRAILVSTDASVANQNDPGSYADIPGLSSFGPGISDWKSTDPAFESFFAVEVIHDVPYQSLPTGAAAANFSRGMSRYGLIGARMTRVLSPQLEQSPVKITAYCTGGVKVPPPDGVAGSVGAWCYDDEGTAGIKSLLAQCATAGVEMLVFAQNMNGTWRSMVANEFPTEANTTWMKGIVDAAHASGIEVGAYQLLRNARSASALNQAAPGNSASLPMSGFDCMDPATGLPDHNHGRASCKGGSGCSALCSATRFYDEMEASMHHWWRATGVSVVDQDGAETGTPCANMSHAHHHGLNDSLWEQYKAVRRTFQQYLTTPMYHRNGTLRAPSTGGPAAALAGGSPVPSVGFILGMPGSVMEAGQAKVPGGYSEMIFGLPRWTWIDRVRESMIASPFQRDRSTSVGQRMFPLPLSAPYHTQELNPAHPGAWSPTSGYETVGTLCQGRCEDHTKEIEWALSGMWGTGAFPMIRSTKLWDGPKSKAMISKWINWQKKYRRVLSAEFVTLAHGNSCWGRSELNISKGAAGEFGGGCTADGLDAVLHRAPKHYYPDIVERGLAMVWNPTNRSVTQTLQATLYYSGLTSTVDKAVMVSQEGAEAKALPLGAGDAVGLTVSLGPRELTWFVITEQA